MLEARVKVVMVVIMVMVVMVVMVGMVVMVMAMEMVMVIKVMLIMIVIVRLSQGEGRVLPQQLWLPMCPFVQVPAACTEQGLPRETSPQAGEKI